MEFIGERSAKLQFPRDILKELCLEVEIGLSVSILQ